MAVEKNLPLEPLWQKVLAKTDGILPKDAVNQWISRIMPVALENGELVLAVRDTFTKQYIEPRYLALLGDAVHQALGADYTIRLVVDAKKAEPAKESVLRPEPAPTKEEPKQSTDTPAQGSLPLTPPPSDTHAAAPDDATTLNPKYTFDAFVTGRSNQFPYAMAKAVADAPGLPSHNPLFIYGGVGLGKTHLMHAVGHKILADHPDRRVLYIASTDFTNEFIRSIREKNMDAFREKYYSIDVLLIDDIQFFAGQEQTQTEFFQTFNKLRDNGSQIILTSDRQPQDVKGLEDRLISRFAGGAVGKGGKAGCVQETLDARAAFAALKTEEAGVEIDVFVNAEGRVEVAPQSLRHVGDAVREGKTVARAGHVAVENAHLPALDAAHAGDDAEQGAFTDAVRADETDGRPARQGEADVVQCGGFAVAVAEVVNGDGGHGQRSFGQLSKSIVRHWTVVQQRLDGYLL